MFLLLSASTAIGFQPWHFSAASSGHSFKKIQLFLKYLVLMLFLTVWIIIMFFTDYMNSQSVKLYCMFVVGCGCAYSIWEKTYVPDARSYIAEKAIALILIVTVFIRLLCF